MTYYDEVNRLSASLCQDIRIAQHYPEFYGHAFKRHLYYTDAQLMARARRSVNGASLFYENIDVPKILIDLLSSSYILDEIAEWLYRNQNQLGVYKDRLVIESEPFPFPVGFGYSPFGIKETCDKVLLVLDADEDWQVCPFRIKSAYPSLLV